MSKFSELTRLLGEYDTQQQTLTAEFREAVALKQAEIKALEVQFSADVLKLVELRKQVLAELRALV